MNRSVWKVRPDDLRRVAAHTDEPERERKLLALAEMLEEADPGNATGGGGTPADTRKSTR